VNIIVRVAALTVATGLGAVPAQDVRAPDARAAVVRLDPSLDELISPDAKLEVIRDDLGVTEGPVWIPEGKCGCLVFTDIAANVIYRMNKDGRFSIIADRAGYTGYDPWNAGWDTNNGKDEKDPLFRRYFLLGANGLAADPQGRIIVASYVGRTVYRLEKNGTRTLLADRYEGRRFRGPNDVVFRKDGSIYFTDTAGGVRGRGHDPTEPLPPLGIYRLKDGQLTLIVSDISNPNGLAFSPDEKTLYATAGRVLRSYDVQADGTVTNSRVFVSMEADTTPGVPDGIRVDVKGNVWATGPGGIWIMSPGGQHTGTIAVNTPGENAASLGFGDRDYKTLYITSRRKLLKIRVNTPGYHVF
jgi:gluconolactonase